MKKIRSTNHLGDNKKPCSWSQPGVRSYRIVLRYDGRQMSVDYHCGPLAGEPTTAGVMECLLLDASGVISADFNFWDWCDEIGLETTRKNKEMFDACEAQSHKLKQFLGDAFDEMLDLDDRQIEARCA